MGKYIDILKKASLGYNPDGLTLAADSKEYDDPVLRRAVQKHLNRHSVFDPNYGEIPKNEKEISLPKPYDLDKEIDQGTISGIGAGATLGMLPTLLGSGNLYVSPILAGAALGGYAINKRIKEQQETYRNLSEKEKQIALKEYLKRYKKRQESGEITESDVDQARGLGAVGALTSALANPVAGKVMMHSVENLAPLKGKQLSQIINSANLKGKLDVERPKKTDNQFNAYFRAYEGEELKKKKGKIGLIKALSPKTWKPGIMAHEVGHADIHNTSAINPVGFMQRRMYKPTMMMNQFGGGLLPVLATNKLVGKDEDNPLMGGLKGGLMGSAANAGVLIPEFEASRRGLKHMMNSPALKGKVLSNAMSTVPAFLTYLSFLAGPSAVAGAIKAYLNKKRKEKEKTAADEDKKLDVPAVGAGAFGMALPYSGLYNVPDTWHGGQGDQVDTLRAFKAKTRAGDILISGAKELTPSQLIISLSGGNPKGYHAAVVEKDRTLRTLDSGPEEGYYRSTLPDKNWQKDNLQILRPIDKKHGREMVRQGRRLADAAENYRWLVEQKLLKKGYSPKMAEKLSFIVSGKLYKWNEGVRAGAKELYVPKTDYLASSKATRRNYKGNMQFIKQYLNVNSRSASTGAQRAADMMHELLEQDKLKSKNPDLWMKIKNKIYKSKGKIGKIYRKGIKEIPGDLESVGLHPDVVTRGKYKELVKCLPAGAGGVCSTVPAVLGKKRIVKGKAGLDITPSDYLRSDQFEPIATYKGGKRSDFKGKFFQDYLLPNAPHVMRAGAGALLGGVGYFGLKGARALKDKIMEKLERKSEKAQMA
jgi:hypothetical protein